MAIVNLTVHIEFYEQDTDLSNCTGCGDKIFGKMYGIYVFTGYTATEIGKVCSCCHDALKLNL